MTGVNPYLNFDGNTEEVFNFYKSVFGGEFVNIIRYKDTPEGEKVAAADKDKIMHIALPLGKHTILMGTDALQSMGFSVDQGNDKHLSINADNEAEADTLFNALSAGGKATLPMHQTFWGAYFGMCTDKFGVQWMVSYDKSYAA